MTHHIERRTNAREKKVPSEDLEFTTTVKLNRLTNEKGECVYVNITVEDHSEGEDSDADEVEAVPVILSAVDPDSVELDEAFRDGENYIARLTAKKAEPANPTQDQLEEVEDSDLRLTVTVGAFESRYTPEMEEGILGFVVDAIRGLQDQDAEVQKPSGHASVTTTEQQG